MNTTQREELIQLARPHISDSDPSHDFLHALRIMALSEKLADAEGGDHDIIVPAALFHDAVNYPKNDPRAAQNSIESAALAVSVLEKIEWYPKEKIEIVKNAIERCSFSKNLLKDRIEEWLVQDADLLESLGAIAVARTFCSTGQMSRAFYDPADPTAKNREFNAKSFALDLFPSRLFQAKERLHTNAAKQLAIRREKFLHVFHDEFVKDILAE